MSFSSSRRVKTRRPLFERMEDRLVLTAAATPHQGAVTQLYQDLLHRLPDAGGLDYWTNQLDRGADTHAVASALTASTEFHRSEVDGVYQRLLNRAADEGGRAFFASALDQGRTIQQIESAVASSLEYAQSHPGASGFLDALFNGTDHLKALANDAYEQVLHRAGDAAGLDYWAGQMAGGVRIEEVTASLAASPERAAMAEPTATVLGTFADASALPTGGAGSLETALAGTAHQALGASASGSGTGAAPLGSGPQAVTLKNGTPAVFQAFGPERLVDTRNTVAGQYGGPAFAAGGTRTINVSPYNLADASIPSAAIGDQPPTSNLPSNVKAVSVILFIVGAPQPEYFTAFATGTSPAPTSTASVFADHAGQIIAASAIVPVNASGNIDIYSSGGGNLIVDVNGYFLDALDGSDNLPISGSVPGNGVVVGSNANTAASSSGVKGAITSAAAGNDSAGVFGTSVSTAQFAAGVLGEVTASASGANAAGVHGRDTSTGSDGYGVFGEHFGSGIGVLGKASGSTGIGVLGNANGSGSFGVLAGGNLGATGTKSFVDPSPSDPSKQIAYVALEGPEAGTYFRGTGHFVNGVATIDVPQTFRDVTDPNGLSIQVTPIGDYANVAVRSIDLNHIALKATADVDFYYTVNGVRLGYAGYNPLQPDTVFVPRSATDTLPDYLNAVQKQHLIDTGVYHADGTVNLTTAHAMGWDAHWAADAGTSSVRSAPGA